MPENFSAAVGAVVKEYTWLMVDALLLLLLLGTLVGYKDFDDPMRTLNRGAFVASLGYFWFSGLHLLIYLRHSDNNEKMPGFFSYGVYCAKAALLVAFGLWAYHRNLL